MLWSHVTNQFVDVNPDDISNFYFFRTILIRTYGHTREQMFPTPNPSLPLFVQIIEIYQFLLENTFDKAYIVVLIFLPTLNLNYLVW